MVPCDESSLEKAAAPAAKTRDTARFRTEIGNSVSGSKNAVGRPAPTAGPVRRAPSLDDAPERALERTERKTSANADSKCKTHRPRKSRADAF
jgi:hypothetical protein